MSDRRSIWQQAFNPETYKDGYGVVREENLHPVAKALRVLDKFLNGPKTIKLKTKDGEIIETSVNKGAGSLELLTPTPNGKVSAVKTVFSKADNVPVTNWDKEALQKLKTGMNQAYEYLSSPEKQLVDLHNLKLAQRMGYKNFAIPTDAKRVITPMKPVNVVNSQNSSILGGIWRDPVDPRKDLVTITKQSYPQHTMYHESLHRGAYGDAEAGFFNPDPVFKDQNNFYKWLNDKIKDINKDVPTDKQADYLFHSGPNELAVNLREIGHINGIEPTSPYPGNVEFQKILNQLKQNKNHAEVLDYVRKDKPLRVWKALNGTYYETGGKLDE